MTDAFRLSFTIVYCAGFIYFLVAIIRFRARDPAVERRVGPLPPPPALISWLVPPIVLLSQVGQIAVEWLPVRVFGAVLGAYAVIVLPWATRVLGRSYVPGPAVLREHELVGSGPFRLVRHPIYSAVAALWLGAALGTLNWILLLLWPMIVVGVTKQARAEEDFLRAKFGNGYDAYALRRSRLVPKPW